MKKMTRQLKKTFSLLVVAALLVTGISSLALPVSAADIDSTLTVEKQVSAPAGNAALTDRYQFMLELSTDAAEPEVNYVVKYYKDSIGGTQLGEISSMGPVGSQMNIDMGAFAPDGYATPGMLSGPYIIGPDASANVTYVVYATKMQFNYTIKYYRGTIQEYALIATEVEIGTFGEEMQIDRYLHSPTVTDPVSYDRRGTIWGNMPDGSAIITSNPAGNVATVTYHANPLRRSVQPSIPASSGSAAPQSVSTPSAEGAAGATASAAASQSAGAASQPVADSAAASQSASAAAAASQSVNAPAGASASQPASAAPATQPVADPAPAASPATQPVALAALATRPVAASAKTQAAPAPANTQSPAQPLLMRTAAPAAPAPAPAAAQVPQPISQSELNRLNSLGFEVMRLSDTPTAAAYLFILPANASLAINGLPGTTHFKVTELGSVNNIGTITALDADKAGVTLSGANSGAASYPTASGQLAGSNARAVFTYTLQAPPASSSSTPPASSSTPPVSSSTPPVSSSTLPVSSSTPPASSSTPPASSSTPPASSTTPPVSSTTPPASSSSTPAASSSSSRPAASSGSASGTSSGAASSGAPSQSGSGASSQAPGTTAPVVNDPGQGPDGPGGPGATNPINPDGTPNFPVQNQQTLDTIMDEGVPVFNIGGTQIPLTAGGQAGVWSLLSLMLGIASIVTAAFTLGRLLLQKAARRKTEAAQWANQPAQASAPAARPVWKTLSMLVGALNLALVLFLQNMHLLMVLADGRTPLFAALLAAQIVLTLLAHKRFAARRRHKTPAQA